MNVILSGMLFSLAILLLFKTVLVSLASRLLTLVTFKSYAASNIIFGLLLTGYAASAADWFYYTGSLTLFVVAVLAVAEGLSIVVLVMKNIRVFFNFVPRDIG
tara:strand:- start:16 stop:324 length:309 start_codon:yes stop_codon:yes gene_type:complete